MATEKHRLGLAEVVHASKSRLERISGLPFADLVNVALFFLTIVSLVIALLAYRDANVSGAKQEAALNSAAQSLATARATLETSQKRLEEMNEAVRQSIEVAKEDQKLLTTAVSVSKTQLLALQKQVEIASRHPIVDLRFECHGLFAQSSTGIFRFGQSFAAPLFSQLSDRPPLTGSKGDVVHLDHNEQLRCVFILINSGTARLSNAYVWLRFEAYGSRHKFGDPWVEYMLHEPVFPHVRPWAPIGFEDVELVKDENVQPAKRLQDKDIEAVHFVDFKIPSWVDHLSFRFEFGGDEQGGQIGEANFTLERPAPAGGQELLFFRQISPGRIVTEFPFTT